MFHSTYRGVTIWLNTEAGHRLRFYTVIPCLAADTLGGIKTLIHNLTT